MSIQLRNVIKTVSVLLLCASISCFSTTDVPENWLPEPSEAASAARGGWIQVKMKTGDELSGELIAVDDDSVHIAGEELRSLARKNIRYARVTGYDSRAWNAQKWSLLGALLTASNGIAALATAPVWIVGGSAITAYQHALPVIAYPEEELERFALYARFPGGMPAGPDRADIRMKPVNR